MRVKLLWTRFHDPDQTSRDLGDVLLVEAEATKHIFESGEHFPGKDELHGSGLANHVANNVHERCCTTAFALILEREQMGDPDVHIKADAKGCCCASCVVIAQSNAPAELGGLIQHLDISCVIGDIREQVLLHKSLKRPI